jgi:hypothetical protein
MEGNQKSNEEWKNLWRPTGRAFLAAKNTEGDN